MYVRRNVSYLSLSLSLSLSHYPLYVYTGMCLSLFPTIPYVSLSLSAPVGYLKNDCVEVDLQSWKQQQAPQPPQEMDDQEVYDDVVTSNDHPDR